MAPAIQSPPQKPRRGIRAGREIAAACLGLAVGAGGLAAFQSGSRPDLPSVEVETGTVQGFSIDHTAMAFDLDGGGSTGFHLTGDQSAHPPTVGTRVRLTVVRLDGGPTVIAAIQPAS